MWTTAGSGRVQTLSYRKRRAWNKGRGPPALQRCASRSSSRKLGSCLPSCAVLLAPQRTRPEPEPRLRSVPRTGGSTRMWPPSPARPAPTPPEPAGSRWSPTSRRFSQNLVYSVSRVSPTKTAHKTALTNRIRRCVWKTAATWLFERRGVSDLGA